MIIKSKNRDKKKDCNRCNQVQIAIGDRYPPPWHMQRKKKSNQPADKTKRDNIVSVGVAMLQTMIVQPAIHLSFLAEAQKATV